VDANGNHVVYQQPVLYAPQMAGQPQMQMMYGQAGQSMMMINPGQYFDPNNMNMANMSQVAMVNQMNPMMNQMNPMMAMLGGAGAMGGHGMVPKPPDRKNNYANQPWKPFPILTNMDPMLLGNIPNHISVTPRVKNGETISHMDIYTQLASNLFHKWARPALRQFNPMLPDITKSNAHNTKKTILNKIKKYMKQRKGK